MKTGDLGGGERIGSLYRDASILVTGGTGFLGKALIEKLLRSLPEIDTIYLLVRTKKGLHPQQRLKALFDSEVTIITLTTKLVPIPSLTHHY
jgi:fatty acyl-CoA reductase